MLTNILLSDIILKKNRRSVMDVLMIVNIIVSLGVSLGGYCMIKYAKSAIDFSIGFRTKRAMSSEEAWHFANDRCGKAWSIIGIFSFVFTIVSVFLSKSDASEAAFQLAILLFQIAAIVVSIIMTECQLKRKFSDDLK